MPVISTNTAANTAVRFLNRNSDDQSNSLAKLASGSNINKASDDAAGLAIATKISTDVAALEQASTNASHAVSVLNTADGGASNIADIVERMKTLASQSASGTVTDVERAYIQAEFSQLQDEIDGITESTRYNGQGLLDGSSDFSVDDTETAAAYASTTAATDYAAAASAVDATATFTVNNTKVTITSASDGTNTTAMDTDALVAAINTALEDGGNYTVSAAKNGDGEIEFTSLQTGDNAKVSISNISSTGDGAALVTAMGLVAGDASGTTTAVDTTGAEIVVGSTSADTINLSIDSLTTEALGISDLDVSTGEGAAEALSVLDMAIDTISDARAKLGAKMSRFEFRSSQIDTSVENLDAAKSAIADVDIAKEQASLSSSSVKVQAAVAAASQANDMPQNLLSLIQ
ncbi:flagellin [Cohaesibacter marisflavi]|uniref:Flagellin n=1 Tax=Cohaesibacter marisflavi TaxID=655353 RepID=A0A1I5CDU6_9HYPH|nr:flagellin [Cohaesibacter marisflavi]SFN85189.1 flagellin [Cohaesibacter marisflavi]